MCGIAGIVKFDGGQVEQNSLMAMNQAMSYRGPDGEGVWLDRGVGLAHLRLAIIDLSSGDQPMTDEDESLVVVFNGEIYNFQEIRRDLVSRGYRFRTNSDTEVLIHGYREWGREMLPRLNGMFAFAIYDKASQTVFIARDRLGVKPLYYYLDEKSFAFASELSGLMASRLVPREIDQTALDLYLHYQYIPPPYTIYRQARKLDPASWMEIDLSTGRMKKNVYWRIRTDQGPDEQRTLGEWIEQLEALLLDAVRIRLISDVPFGAFLSGGTDSGLVVAMMAGIMKEPIKTFSIGLADQVKDELPFARQIAEKYRTDHEEFSVTHEGLKLIPKLCGYFGEPFADSSAVPTYYVSKMARNRVKMVLTGDGGDEMFAGYRSYSYLLHWLSEGLYTGPVKVDSSLTSRMRSIAAKVPGLKPLVQQLRRTGREIGHQKAQINGKSIWPNYFDRSMCHFSYDERRALLGNSAKLSEADYFASAFPFPAADSVVTEAQYCDINSYLSGDILVKVDRMSMANSLEVRSPLLDYRIAELAFSIPTRFKLPEVHLDGMKNKFILKELATRYLGSEYVYRPKEGFGIPVSQWLREDRDNYLKDSLLNNQANIYSYLDREMINNMVTSHLSGSQDYGTKLWNILMLDGWINQVDRT